MTTKDKKKVTKSVDPKPETKPADPKPETKPADPKPETKPADPKPETKPADPKPETKPWNKIEISKKDEKGNFEFIFPELPMLKTMNTKVSWIVFFSILTVIILFGLINFLSGKFIENSKAVAEVSNSLISYNEEVKEIAKAVDKKISVLEAKVDVIDKNVDKNQTAVMSWLKPAAEMLDRHEAKFVKMTKEVSYLKKKKAEEIKKAEEEALKDLEITDPPALDLETPVEKKQEETKPEGTEDGGKTSSVGKTTAVGKTMPEIDNKDDSESEIKITVRKISKK